MIDRYTPVTRLRNASQPNTAAKIAGTSIAIRMANGKKLKPCQYQGSSFQFRNTMKSGSSALPYWPRLPICRIRYMPIA